MTPAALAADYARRIAQLAGCDAAHLAGLDRLALDVLYFGILSDDAPARFRRMMDHLDTAALELYADRPGLAGAERAYCRHVLARRAVAAR